MISVKALNITASIRTMSGVIAMSVAMAVEMASASSVVVDQGAYDRLADQRNSNTETNGNPATGAGSNQQVADDFTVGIPGMRVTQVNLWFVYQFGVPAPVTQAMVLRVWNDVSGLAGSIVFEDEVSFTPIATGDLNSFGRAIFRGEVLLSNPFVPNPGERYWLNPLGDDDTVTWGWQFADANRGQRLSRNGNAVTPEVWRALPGNFAFQLVAVPEPSGLLLLGVCGIAFGMRRGRRV